MIITRDARVEIPAMPPNARNIGAPMTDRTDDVVEKEKIEKTNVFHPRG